MKFKLQGDPADKYSGPDEDVIHGVKLSREKFTEVSDPKVIKRLKGHSHVVEADVGRPPNPKPEPMASFKAE